MESIDDYLTTREASERFGLSAKHLGYLSRKEIIKARKVGHDWFIYIPSLNAYLETNPRPGVKPGSKHASGKRQPRASQK